MKQRKAQITLFVIIGIVLILSTTITLYVRQSSVEKELIPEIAKLDGTGEIAIRNYVEACLKKVSDEVVWDVGMHGGYVNDEDFDGIEFQGSNVSNWTTDQPPPSLPDINNNISNEIIPRLEKCLDLDIFADMGYLITKEGIASTNVSINQKDIDVKINYPLSIKKGESETTISEFSVNLPIKLKELYNYSSKLAIESTNNACGFEYDGDSLIALSISPLLEDDTTKIVRFTDYKTYIHYYVQSYIFQFATDEEITCTPPQII